MWLPPLFGTLAVLGNLRFGSGKQLDRKWASRVSIHALSVSAGTSVRCLNSLLPACHALVLPTIELITVNVRRYPLLYEPLCFLVEET